MGLLALAGLVDVVVGLGAIAGTERLEANVREIETSEGFGELYFSLGVWGSIVLVLGVGALVATRALWRNPPRGRLGALIAAYFALAAAFLGLAIFRWAAVATIPLLLGAIYVLSYHVAGTEDDHSPAP